MGYAVAHTTVSMLRNMRADKQFSLTEISHQLQKMAQRSSELSQKYATHMTQYLNDSDEDLIYVGELEDIYLEYKPELDRIQYEEKQLNAKKIQAETELKEIESSLESYQKLEEQGIKESVMSSGS